MNSFFYIYDVISLAVSALALISWCALPLVYAIKGRLTL